MQGAKLSTVYTWNFNDSTGTLNFTGFESASLLNHTFTKPGIYNINLTASNAAGSSDTMMSLQVYGKKNKIIYLHHLGRMTAVRILYVPSFVSCPPPLHFSTSNDQKEVGQIKRHSSTFINLYSLIYNDIV